MTQRDYDKQAAGEIIASFGARAELLVQILHGFIDRFGWISEDAIRQLAEELNISRADVHGVVSAPVCSAPCAVPAAPPSLCISTMSGTWPQIFGLPSADQMSAISAIGEDGVIG